jgi:hypothetical protein
MVARWVIVLLGLSTGGWMGFDGLHALVTHDYVTPRTGPHAGQLGPWSRLVVAIGLEPRSALMKSLFVAYGIAWLSALAAFALDVRGGRWAVLVVAFASLWYVPMGTALSAAVIALLLLPPFHAQ